ncbi:MAG: hypothetical protein JW882_21865 [Deltaproteobacteria bacterium]|nr:hypothetical protein [Deltaproteobacteria bacterium]
MKCPNCSKEMNCKPGKYHYTESGLNNIYLSGVEICKCNDCGESSVSLPAIMELHRLICLTLVSKDTLLTGNEIRFLRKNAGYSAKEFTELIGVDKSTFSRWENDNQVMANTNDRLIRLAYLNIKGITQKEIEHIIKDKFKGIDPKKKEPSYFNIPVKKWANHNTCRV